MRYHKHVVKLIKFQHSASPVMQWLQTKVQHNSKRDPSFETEAPLKHNRSAEPIH